MSKNVNEQGVMKSVDHVIASNMRPIVELAMVKGAIGKHELLFRNQQGKDLSHENVSLRRMVVELKKKMVDRDEKINELQALVDSFQFSLSNQDEDIIKKNKEIARVNQLL